VTVIGNMKYMTWLKPVTSAHLVTVAGNMTSMNFTTSIKYIASAVLLLSFVINGQTQQNTLTAKEESEGWILLFDGKSTDAWRGYNKKTFPESGWEVRDEQLVITFSGNEEAGSAGDIITKEKFGNFELSLEFMLTDSANSGIFYMVTGFEDNPIWHLAPEYQILDNPTYESMLGDWMEKHRTGDNYDMEAAEVDYSNPVGEWNTARIVRKGHHIEHWLNGNLAVEYKIGSIKWKKQVAASKFSEYKMYGMAKQGNIGLQDHGHEVMFRNIKIRRL
jgi:alpha-3'-ketoglucosidase